MQHSRQLTAKPERRYLSIGGVLNVESLGDVIVLLFLLLRRDQRATEFREEPGQEAGDEVSLLLNHVHVEASLFVAVPLNVKE
jgi:hypothetical protein